MTPLEEVESRVKQFVRKIKNFSLKSFFKVFEILNFFFFVSIKNYFLLCGSTRI